MKVKYALFLSLIIIFILNPFLAFTQGNETMVEISNKKIGSIFEFIQHKDKFYGIAVNIADKKDRQLRMLCLDSQMQIEWTQIISHNFNGIASSAKIIVGEEQLLTFISDKVDEKIIEKLIRLDFSGSIIEANKVIYESDNANFLQKYVYKDNVYLLPLKMEKAGNISSSSSRKYYRKYNLITSSLLEYYCFNIKSQSIEKKGISLKSNLNSFSNINFKNGFVYVHTSNANQENEVHSFSLVSGVTHKLNYGAVNINTIIPSDIRNYFNL
jgi:hypothetical protein